MVLPLQSPLSEIADFLALRPTHEQMLAFRLSAPLEERAEYLLDRNRKGSITEAELAEMNQYLQANNLMSRVKARARLQLSTNE